MGHEITNVKVKTVKGSCLCGDIKFELSIERLKIYQCHCNLCRKQTGTASSCGSVVSEENFSWLTGEHLITKWEKDSGFTSHFCSACGSSVPNKFRDNPFYWVPAGTIDSDKVDTVVNIFTGEKSHWSNVDSSVNSYKNRSQVHILLKRLSQ
jgi:hypothetical protein